MDRIVGTSMHSVLEELFDADFTESNFGFRAGRRVIVISGVRRRPGGVAYPVD
jgi:hypothetical protein